VLNVHVVTRSSGLIHYYRPYLEIRKVFNHLLSYFRCWFGIAKGVLDEALLWTRSTRPGAGGGGCSSSLCPPGYATELESISLVYKGQKWLVLSVGL
jgi:hypothetical protein